MTLFSKLNFPLVMFILIVVTGVVWLLDKYLLRAKRPVGAAEPWYVDWSKSFFPVILLVFLLRSFLLEPFRIPSDSMVPTLLNGDFIVVNKFTWGIRIPIINRKIIDVSKPERGDVMVFRYPRDPSQDYIKRIIGLPGDTVEYRSKELIINGKKIQLTKLDTYEKADSGLNYIRFDQFRESLGTTPHRAIVDPQQPPVRPFDVMTFPFHENCEYNVSGFICKVPDGHYFMMGDNRDQSSDSRYWGFVPDQNIVGKAFFVWMNFSDLKRIGSIE